MPCSSSTAALAFNCSSCCRISRPLDPTRFVPCFPSCSDTTDCCAHVRLQPHRSTSFSLHPSIQNRRHTAIAAPSTSCKRPMHCKHSSSVETTTIPFQEEESTTLRLRGSLDTHLQLATRSHCLSKSLSQNGCGFYKKSGNGRERVISNKSESTQELKGNDDVVRGHWDDECLQKGHRLRSSPSDRSSGSGRFRKQSSSRKRSPKSQGKGKGKGRRVKFEERFPIQESLPC